MNGSEALLAFTAAGKAVRALGSSFGSALTESARSLFAPGRLTTFRRSVNTGTARCRTGWTLCRNGSRLRVATFEVLTSGSRSSSAARRLTKVVFACRSVPGRTPRLRSKARFWLAIAPRALFEFEINPERSLLRSLTAVKTREELTMKLVSTPSSRFSSWSTRSVALSEGAKYL